MIAPDAIAMLRGEPRFLNPCLDSVCLSQTVTYKCESGSPFLLRWRVLDTNGRQYALTVGYIDGNSSITFTAVINISNYVIECGPDFISRVNCSIVIPDILPAPVANPLTFGSTHFTFSWSPSTGQCFSNYAVSITSSVSNVTYMTNDTSLVIPISESFNDTEYSVSVGAVDTGGRYNSSEVMRFTPNVPLSVTNLTLTQTDYPTDTHETVNITVSWNEPQSSSRPPITQYNFQYSISNEIQNISTNVTSLTLSGFTVGSVYTVGVAAINVLGAGTVTSATITILLATPLPPEILSTSRVDFTSSFTSGCNCASSTTLPIAVSVSVTFILTAILSSTLTLILTLLCVRSRSNKPVEQVELVEQAKRDEGGSTASVAVYDEITTTKGGATSSVPLTSNPAYGPLRN
uniref:Fibronectin type-III domain-containing protein n=1 Tax=Amphimedon queenslandica TaxID=400682 RepID=A0A1X7ULN7_AMPQE